MCAANGRTTERLDDGEFRVASKLGQEFAPDLAVWWIPGPRRTHPVEEVADPDERELVPIGDDPHTRDLRRCRGRRPLRQVFSDCGMELLVARSLRDDQVRVEPPHRQRRSQCLKRLLKRPERCQDDPLAARRDGAQHVKDVDRVDVEVNVDSYQRDGLPPGDQRCCVVSDTEDICDDPYVVVAAVAVGELLIEDCAALIGCNQQDHGSRSRQLGHSQKVPDRPTGSRPLATAATSGFAVSPDCSMHPAGVARRAQEQARGHQRPAGTYDRRTCKDRARHAGRPEDRVSRAASAPSSTSPPAHLTERGFPIQSKRHRRRTRALGASLARVRTS